MAANPEDIRKRNVRNNPKPVNNIYVAGIDPSLTGTGVCVMNQNDVEDFKVTVFGSKLIGISRLSEIEEKVLSLVKDCNRIFIEGFSYMSRGRSVFDLAGLGNILRLGFYRGALLYNDIPPTVLKKYVTSKGNANKNIVLEQCFRKFGKGSDVLVDDNAVDSYCLARLGIDFLNWEKQVREEDTFKKYELEAFEKIGPMQFSIAAVSAANAK